MAAFAIAAWHVSNRRDLVSDVLAVAIVVNLSGFVASIIPATPFDTREMAALLPALGPPGEHRPPVGQPLKVCWETG